MPKLIKNRRIETDPWSLLRCSDGVLLAQTPSDWDVIVPLEVWRTQRELVVSRAGRLGVLLAPNQDPADIAEDLRHFALVAVDFPKFTDGRGFSTARLLRERYKYRGEVRAVGDVIRDLLPLMEQCGFDAYLLREDQDAEAALASFGVISDSYQATVAQPLPLFRRRSDSKAHA